LKEVCRDAKGGYSPKIDHQGCLIEGGSAEASASVEAGTKLLTESLCAISGFRSELDVSVVSGEEGRTSYEGVGMGRSEDCEILASLMPLLGKEGDTCSGIRTESLASPLLGLKMYSVGVVPTATGDSDSALKWEVVDSLVREGEEVVARLSTPETG
jgi:hypothetical protein